MAEDKKDEKKEDGGEKKKNSMILFIIIGVLVLLLVVIGVVAAMLMGGGEEQAAEHAPAADAHGAAPAAHGTEQKPKTKTKSNLMTIGPLFPMEQLVVNLLSQSGRRYLKASISFEMSVAEMQAELDGKKPVIRDIVIGVLSSKTIEEISTSKGKDKLKDEIIAKVNEVIVDGQIKNVFFTDFVIQ